MQEGHLSDREVFLIHDSLQSEWKFATTSMAFTKGISMQHKQVDKVMEE